MELFITAVGLLLIIEGLPYFINPNGMKNIAGILLAMNSRNLRIGGLVLMSTGLVILYVVHGI
jgi:hypothetical protein